MGKSPRKARVSVYNRPDSPTHTPQGPPRAARPSGGRAMKALVLEEKGRLSLRDFDIPGTLGPRDVRIKTHTVGICGSDVHYYTHGKIGHFVVREPMVLGHEA